MNDRKVIETKEKVTVRNVPVKETSKVETENLVEDLTRRSYNQ